MFNDINAAETLGVENSDLRRSFGDRQISSETFNSLQRGRFDPFFPSDEIRKRFREIANELGEADAFIESLPALTEIRNELRQLNLNEPFQIDINEYLIEEIQTPPLPASVTSAMPNNQTITQGQNILQQAQLTENGLTRTENAFLREEDKELIRRNRGFV